MRLRRLIGVAATILGILVSVATVAAFFGSIWWGLDLIANFRWQLMWLALIASVAYALTERGMFTAVFLTAALVNLWLIAPAWIGSQPEATGEDGVRIVHVDLSGRVRDMPEVARWLLTSQADLLLVAGVTAGEVDPVVIDSSPYTLLSSPGDQAGIAIIGRDQWIVNTTLSDAGDQVHAVVVPSGSGVISVITTWGGMGTSPQASEALAGRFAKLSEVVGDANDRVVVIGSLGATKWSNATNTLLSDTGLRDATAGAGHLMTAQGSDLPIIGRWMRIPIDVAFLGPELTPLELAVGPEIGAGHLPLTIVVGPKQ